MNGRLFGENRVKRLAVFAVVIAAFAGVSATAASAAVTSNQTPGCQTSAWDFTLTGVTSTGDAFTQGYMVNPVERCHPAGSSTGTWTLSGDVFLIDPSGAIEDGCRATVSGTLRDTGLSADWSWGDPCTGEVTSFTGTLNWGTAAHPTTGSGSGTFTDNNGSSGTWTADRTS